MIKSIFTAAMSAITGAMNVSLVRNDKYRKDFTVDDFNPFAGTRPTRNRSWTNKVNPAGTKIARLARDGVLTLRHRDGVAGAAIREAARERNLARLSARSKTPMLKAA